MPKQSYFNNHEDYLNWYRNYREKNRKKLRDYNKNYIKKRRADKNYVKKNSHKIASRKLTDYALEKGIIKRGKCEVCDKPNGQAHHENYLKPLEIHWLCKSHHLMLHHSKIDKLPPNS